MSGFNFYHARRALWPVVGAFLLVGFAAWSTNAFAGTGASVETGQMVNNRLLNHEPRDIGRDFGRSVAIQGDRALIGSNGAVARNDSSGMVFALFRHNGYWEHPLKLFSSVADTREEFGFSVAMDGNTAVVGAPFANIGSNEQQGAVYVFTLSGEIWTQVAKLSASDGAAGDFFGFNVAISGDTILVQDGLGSATTATYVFTGAGDAWTQTQKIMLTTPQVGAAVQHVVIAINGTTALITGGNFGVATTTVHVFTKSGGTWSETATLAASDGKQGDSFGGAVALSGTTALIGAPSSLNGGKGAAYVFTQTGGAWSQTAELTASDGAAHDLFGATVALDGGTAVIGAPNAFTDGFTTNQNESQGAVYVFTDSGGTWSQSRKLVAMTDAGTLQVSSNYGGSVAVSGSDILVGEPVGGEDDGLAFFYNGQPADISLAISDPATVVSGGNYTSRVVVTNNGAAATGGVTVYVGNSHSEAAAGTFVTGVTTSQGRCVQGDPASRVCDLGVLSANGVVSIDVSRAVSGPVGATITDPVAIEAVPSITAATATKVAGDSNQPPVASNGSLTTNENTAASGTLSASDPDGDTLTFSIVAQPTHGKVNLDDDSTGAFTYTPTTGYTGPDSFTFKTNDGKADSNTATVSITVTASANKPPVASAVTLTTDENTAASGTLSASDPDGDALTFVIVDDPMHGTVKLDDPATGAFTYTPTTDYSGPDSFTFKAKDGKADSNVATVSITVNAAAPPPPPPPPPPSGGSDSGGGATVPFGLALLGLVVLLAFLRRRFHLPRNKSPGTRA